MRFSAVRAACAFLIAPAVAAAETFSFAHVYEPDSIYHRWAEWAADEIAERTHGRHEVEVFPAGSLGDENEIFEGLSLGTVDMTLSGSFYASNLHGPMAISSAPFMFRDFDHWLAYRDSDVFDDIAAGYEEASGHRVLGLMYYGARHLTANRRIEAPEDMEGMKLRVPNARMYLLFPRSVGANPAPIDFAEVYLALAQGVVDGQENPLPTILAKKFYEVQSHIMLTGHLMDSLIVQISGQVWDSLSEEDRAVFGAVFEEMAEGVTQDVRRAEDELAGRFESEFGVEVVEVDREPFRAAMQPLLEGEDLPWTTEHLEAVEAIR